MDQLLTHFNSIHSMPTALIKYLKSAAIPRTLKDKELLLSSDFLNLNMCFIKRGLIRSIFLEGGVDSTRHFFKENDVILVEDIFRRLGEDFSNLQALEELDIIWFTTDDMEDMYSLFPELNYIIRQFSIDLNISYADHHRNTTLTTNQARLEWFIARYPDLALRVPDIYLASYLDIPFEDFKELITSYSN